MDGGSEFMKHFEEAREELGIELFILPPKRPQYKGVLKEETEPSERSSTPEEI